MVRSLYSGVSGLRTHQTRMDVIGNNIANVNTYGYKASRVAFKDIFYQSISGASAPQGTAGGTNPKQVGYGSQVGSIDVLHTRSGFQMTDLGTDLAIAGEGFFQTMDASGNLLYTRAGMLRLDASGNLTDVNGNRVIGTNGSRFNDEATGQDGIQLVVPELDSQAAKVEKELLGSLVSIEMKDKGPQGNMTFMFVNGKDPSMTNKKGNVVTIYFDHSQKLTTVDDLKAKMDYSFLMGGVQLSTSDMNITFNPDPKLDIKPAKVDGAMTATGGISAAAAFANAGGAGGAIFTDGAVAPAVPAAGVVDLSFSVVPGGLAGNKVQVAFSLAAQGSQPSARWIDNKLQVTLPAESKITAAELNSLVKNAAGKAPSGVQGIQFTTSTTGINNTAPLNTGAMGASNVAAPLGAAGGLDFTISAGATDDRLNALQGDGIKIKFFQGGIPQDAIRTGVPAGPVTEGAGFWDDTTLYIPVPTTGGLGTAADGSVVLTYFTTAQIQSYIDNADKTLLNPAYTAGGDLQKIIDGLKIDFGTNNLDVSRLPTATATSIPLTRPFTMTATDGSAPAKQTIPDVGGAQVSVVMGQTGEQYNGFEVVFKTVAGADEGITKNGNNQIVITLDSENTAPVDQTKIDRLLAAFVATLDPSETALKNMNITINGTIDVEDLRDRQNSVITMKMVGGENTLMQNILPLLGTMSLTGGRNQSTQSVGDLASVTIGADGVISAIHDGEIVIFGRIELATFDNPQGLEQVGNSYFRITNNSGEPKKGVAGRGATGGLVSGGLEMSNVDLSGAFTDMITTQRGFQANSRIITVSDEMLQELVNLKR